MSLCSHLRSLAVARFRAQDWSKILLGSLSPTWFDAWLGTLSSLWLGSFHQWRYFFKSSIHEWTSSHASSLQLIVLVLWWLEQFVPPSSTQSFLVLTGSGELGAKVSSATAYRRSTESNLLERQSLSVPLKTGNCLLVCIQSENLLRGEPIEGPHSLHLRTDSSLSCTIWAAQSTSSFARASLTFFSS